MLNGVAMSKTNIKQAIKHTNNETYLKYQSKHSNNEQNTSYLMALTEVETSLKVLSTTQRGTEVNAQDFESTLFKMSIKAIHELSGNTQDIILVEEAIEHANLRPILTCVQIWEVDFDKEDRYCDINFVLSPEFMEKNEIFTLNGYLNQLKWIFEIQHYDYGEDEELNKVGEEDGLDGWLVKSKITTNFDSIKIALINFNEFETAIQIAESDQTR